MARRIPLRDIPNAPGVVAQPTGGNLRRVNLGAAQGMLQRQTIAPDAFQGPAKGMAALAQGVGSIAGAGEKFAKAALHLQGLVDEDMLYKGRAALRQGAFNAKAEMEARPEDYRQWGQIASRHMTDAYEGFLKGMPDISDRAKVLMEREYSAMHDEIYGSAQVMGMRQVAQNVRAGVLNDVKMFQDAGDMDGVIGTLEAQRGKGVMTDAEIDMMIQAARPASEVGRLAALRLERPDLAIEEARESKWLSPAMKLAEMQKSRAATAQKDADTIGQAAVLIHTGQVEKLEDVAAYFGEYGQGFVSRNLEGLKRMLDRGAASDFGAANEILQDVAKMDIPDDPDERAILHGQTMARVNTVLRSGEGGKVKERINSYFGEGKRPWVANAVSDRMKDIVDSKGFGGGYDKKKANNGDRKEIENRTRTFANQMKAYQLLEDWRTQNPKASGDDVLRELDSIIDANGWGPPAKVPWTWPWNDPKGIENHFIPNFSSPESMNYRDASDAEWGSAPRGANVSLPAGHRVTSYGGKWDPLIDTNSLKGIGAWSNQLEDGLSFAASRDVEVMLKRAGVAKNDLVELTLDNGERVVVRFADRTAREYKGKQLTGRWDIYSKDGPHPLDGVAVKAFRKVEA